MKPKARKRPSPSKEALAHQGGKPRRGGDQHRRPDPRPAAQILAEEVLLNKAMLAKVLGYSVRSVDRIVQEDCAADDPCLKPVYLRVPHKRRGRSGALFPENFPSFMSLRFRREDVLRYIAKMQRGFPEDLEWRARQSGA